MNKGIVKCVMSGDTLIVRGNAVNGPPPEKTINLAHVTAPRFGPKDQPDEFFAFESREFLRKKLVGKLIDFKIEYRIASGREFATVLLNGECINELAVSEGAVKVRTIQDNEFTQNLQKLQLEAQEKGIGLWMTGDGVKPVVMNYNPPADPFQFVKKFDRKEIPALVEKVNDAGNFRLLLQDEDYQIIYFQISGIKVPSCKKDIPNQVDVIEPFGEEAKYFVESRLLQRDVKIILESVVGSTFTGTILHPAGNIAEHLLSNGFAQLTEWSLSNISADVEKYRLLENNAKQQKLRIWKLSQSQSDLSVKGKNFSAVVTRIITPDTIQVTVNDTKDYKISLSSFRAPRLKEEKEAFYSHQAKEYLRSKLIGNQVNVSIEYQKTGVEGQEDRTYATIVFGPMNITEALLNKGLGSVVRHKKDDQDRSHYYDQLLLAEDRAKQGKKGMWSNQEPPVLRINDASENIAKARSFLPAFQRAGTIPAVVEYVANASRFKIYLPKQECRINFIVSGLRVPKYVRNDPSQSEPFGEESVNFMTRMILQHDVEIFVENVDKGGNFLGSIRKKNDNIALILLQRGYAQVFNADNLKHASQLYAAEQTAKDLKLGIWSLEQKIESEQSEKDFKPIDLKIEILQVLDASHIKAKILEGSGSDSQKFSEFFLAYVKTPPKNSGYGPDAISCLESILTETKVFSARIEYRIKDSNFVSLHFDDYGSLGNTVNGDLVARGYAQVDRKFLKDQRAAPLLQLQQEARINRFGFYEFGDYSLDEDDE